MTSTHRDRPMLEGGRRNPGEGHRDGPEEESSSLRLVPSSGVQSPNGILGPAEAPSPRMDKRGQGHRHRGSRRSPSTRRYMRYVGIDMAAEMHVVAVLDDDRNVLLKPTSFGEDAD